MQVNQIQLSQIATNDSEAHQFPLTKAQIKDYKQQFDKQSLQKNKMYLQAIQSHNKELVAKMKELDKKLNAQIDILSKKIVSPSKKRHLIPKPQQFETTELQNKFKELQKIKRELQLKKTGINSLDFLLSVREKYKMQLSQLNKEIATKKQQLSAFDKLKQKLVSKDQVIQNQVTKMGEFNIYDNEIEQLRKKVRLKSQQVKTKKDQFFKLYKQNRSNKSIIAQPEPTKEPLLEEDSELSSLKQKYMQMGKKIELLKNKKANLLKNKVDCSQQKRTLDKLKQKLQNITKITNK